MNYYSTNGKAPIADLQKAVVKGLAEDRGLYMPERIEKLPKAFFDNIQDMKFQDIAYNVASNFFGEDVDEDALQDIVYDTLSFDCPVVEVKDNIYTLELFHGPTLAFKDCFTDLRSPSRMWVPDSWRDCWATSCARKVQS